MNAKVKPIRCYVTDRKQLPAGRSLQEAIQSAIEGGVDWVQIREKDLPAQQLCNLVRAALLLAQPRGTQILVNDRLDVAIAAGAGGVHLGGESLPAVKVAAWVRRAALASFLVGKSCHSVDDLLRAEQDGAGYAILGPVFSTPSKLAFGAPLGLDVLRSACGRVHIPVLAIGGITAENAPQCIEAGAAGYAAIRFFQSLFPFSAAPGQRIG